MPMKYDSKLCRKLCLPVQKINFKPHLSLEILQRFCKHVILGTLGISGHAHQKLKSQLVGKFAVYLQAKKSTPSIPLLRYCKYVANLLLWVLWKCLAMANRHLCIS